MLGRGLVPPALASLPGSTQWKELAMASIEAANGCGQGVSTKAVSRMKSIIADMPQKDRDWIAMATRRVQKKGGALKDAPYGLEAGMVGPVEGLFDPWKLSAQVNEGELLFFREAEIKHGRVCMLASLGFYVGEKFHPFFGGWDGPSIQAPVNLEYPIFWPVLFAVCGLPEIASLGRIDYNSPSAGFTPQLKPGLEPGDLGFDPLGIKPDDPADFLVRQNQEILHGRLGMIAAAGMIAQEVLTQSRLDEGGLFNEVGLG